MKRRLIRKGNHYLFPFFAIGKPIWVAKNETTEIEDEFMFTDSCLFDLKDEDQGDVNKLLGFSIGWHHKTSFRFGWRPILAEKTVEIVAYEYHDGVRQVTKPLCRIKPFKWICCKLTYDPVNHLTLYKITHLQDNFVYVDNKAFVADLKKDHGLGYTLGIYFGGNEKAPQDILIYKR